MGGNKPARTGEVLHAEDAEQDVDEHDVLMDVFDELEWEVLVGQLVAEVAYGGGLVAGRPALLTQFHLQRASALETQLMVPVYWRNVRSSLNIFLF